MGGIQNYSFLNFFLPRAETAQKARQALTEAGIDGAFYWYDNLWHYHRKWDHLKNLQSPGRLPAEATEGMKTLSERDFSASDTWMQRNISLLIKLSWSEAEVAERGQKLREVLKRVL